MALAQSDLLDEMLKRHDQQFVTLDGFIGSGTGPVIVAMRYFQPALSPHAVAASSRSKRRSRSLGDSVPRASRS
ncbi:hypothetical protein Thiowin_05100 [Thiorhodovibrio winogradskyi]|uniref:Uncharacterized protein n=1 Tax=Thiorhodovibrio winogradskyi TaxID=77007 RepID=A0ABZ0SL63_9GAMM